MSELQLHCPVSSFQKYINHLNPKCPVLWQRPKKWKDVSKSGLYTSQFGVWIPFDSNCVFLEAINVLSNSLTNVKQNIKLYLVL